ncbi:hypothetical protein PR048_009418 [Dryococelus australis]|uniref:Uncharacterized protein n=1 Tax=Dryococelus australis TaxID=614101 RepID=A0ABQ9I1M9_9NEOP|nr:hypothetical protein PR048_009418 [Dryococelus australis]
MLRTFLCDETGLTDGFLEGSESLRASLNIWDADQSHLQQHRRRIACNTFRGVGEIPMNETLAALEEAVDGLSGGFCSSDCKRGGGGHDDVIPVVKVLEATCIRLSASQSAVPSPAAQTGLQRLTQSRRRETPLGCSCNGTRSSSLTSERPSLSLRRETAAMCSHDGMLELSHAATMAPWATARRCLQNNGDSNMAEVRVKELASKAAKMDTITDGEMPLCTFVVETSLFELARMRRGHSPLTDHDLFPDAADLTVEDATPAGSLHGIQVTSLETGLSIEGLRQHKGSPTKPMQRQASSRGEIAHWICIMSLRHLANRYGGNTARLARRSDEVLGVRVSVALIAPSLLDLRCGVPTGVHPTLNVTEVIAAPVLLMAVLRNACVHFITLGAILETKVKAGHLVFVATTVLAISETG